MTDHNHKLTTSSQSCEWYTPQWLADQLADEFGPFDTDPAATPETAKAPVFYTKEDDGFIQPWKGRVFLNPPYGRLDITGRSIADWMDRAREAVESGEADLVVCLVPARVDSRWYRRAVAGASLVRVWPSRIEFIRGDGDKKGQESGMGCGTAVIVFGKLEGQHGSEPKWCENPGCHRWRRIFWPARSNARTCSDRCRKALSRR